MRVSCLTIEFKSGAARRAARLRRADVPEAGAVGRVCIKPAVSGSGWLSGPGDRRTCGNEAECGAGDDRGARTPPWTHDAVSGTDDIGAARPPDADRPGKTRADI